MDAESKLETNIDASKTISIIIADDHALIRQSLKNTFKFAVGFRVIGEADNGADAVRLAQELQPDVAILDIGMPVLNGIEATRKIKKLQQNIIVLVLTVHNDSEHVLSMLEAGADGYLTKNIMAEEIVQAVRSLTVGDTVISSSVFKDVLKYALKYSENKYIPSNIPVLSSREIDTLKYIALGKSNKEIALQLNISTRTVKGHCMDIFRKLNVYSRTEAAITALRLGVLSLKDLE